jgi:5-hydroxyisourate hydrolase-like protein (transthyretin family)
MAGTPKGSGTSMAGMGDATSQAPPGQMRMPAAPPAAPDWQHLEVHIVAKATGKPVRDADVSIVVTSTATKHQEVVPVAVMYGVQAGEADWHYGNNVKMPAGTYRVDVVVNREKAEVEITVPAS